MIKRLTRAVTLRASAFGERRGWEWLTYNHGVYLHFHWMAQDDAPKMADALLDNLPEFRSLADVGCGSGAFAAEFQRRGILTIGCEYSPKGRRMALRQEVEVFPFDVSKPYEPLPGVPFDVAMSLEVGEHIAPELADAFVEFLCRTAGRFIVLTCARPGQGGQGHVNEQPYSYWIKKVEAWGWTHSPLSAKVSDTLKRLGSNDWLWRNVMVFELDPRNPARPATT